MADLLNIFITAVKAVLTVAFLYGLGIVLARRKLLDKMIVGKISRLVAKAMLPCLSFRTIAGGFSQEYITEHWPLAVAGVCAIILAFLGGELLAVIAKPTPTFRPWFVLAVTWPNVVAIPLVFVVAICDTEESGAQAQNMCIENATVRVFTFTLMFSFLTFTVSYLYVLFRLWLANEHNASVEKAETGLETGCKTVEQEQDAQPGAPEEVLTQDVGTNTAFDIDELKGTIVCIDDPTGFGDSESTKLEEGTLDVQCPEGKEMQQSEGDAVQTGNSGEKLVSGPPEKEAAQKSGPSVCRTMIDSLIYNPPVMANLFAQVLAYTSANQLFYGKDPPLQVISSAISLIAAPTTTLLNLVTAASFAHQLMELKSPKDMLGGANVGISRWTMFVLVIGKIIVMPMFFFVLIINILDWMPEDRWTRLVLFIQTIAPTAPMMIVLAQVMGLPQDAQLMALSTVPQFLLFLPTSIFFVASALSYTEDLKTVA